jgi:hypothetical protein
MAAMVCRPRVFVLIPPLRLASPHTRTLLFYLSAVMALANYCVWGLNQLSMPLDPLLISEPIQFP